MGVCVSMTARDAERFAGDDPHARLAVGARRLGDALAGDLLVARPRQLQARRQVHPDLEAVHAAALLADALRRHLRVHDAGAGGHPLHVAGRRARRGGPAESSCSNSPSSM